MFSIRYILRLIQAFFSRFKALIILGVVLGFGIFFLINLIIPALTSNHIEKIGMTGRFTANSLPSIISNLISDGLTKVDGAGIATPGLATSWETPDKGKTWIFKLDSNKTWQDGTSIKAKDINYEFSDLTIERPDDSTIIFKLQNPYSAFPVVVSKAVFKKGFLGSGQWEVKDVKVTGGYITQLTLVNSEKDTKIFKFYPNEDRVKLAFKLGEINQISGIMDPAPFDTWKRLQITKSANHNQYVVIFFNTNDQKLGEKNLRQALSYAINKNAFEKERAISPISIDSWAHNPQVKPYTYDKGKAAKTITELPKELTNGIEITLTTSPSLLSVAEKVANDWKDVGIPTKVAIANSVPSDYQALLAVLDAPVDPDQYSLWHSTQTSTNISHYSNQRIDKLLEDGRSELDHETRRKIYLDFQRYLLEDAPAAFLYYPDSYTITR